MDIPTQIAIFSLIILQSSAFIQTDEGFSMLPNQRAFENAIGGNIDDELIHLVTSGSRSKIEEQISHQCKVRRILFGKNNLFPCWYFK